MHSQHMYYKQPLQLFPIITTILYILITDITNYRIWCNHTAISKGQIWYRLTLFLIFMLLSQ